MDDSDYIAYFDESGDPSLASINPEYPIFVVAFAIINKTQYSSIVSDLLKLKFDTFGHDQIVLHEREIRKRTGEFGFFKDPAERPKFLSNLSAFVRNADFTLLAAIIRKDALVGRYKYPDNPYEIALTFCLERTYEFLKDRRQETKRTFIIAESRGRREDDDLELAFRRTCSGENQWSCTLPLAIRFAHKQSNSTGMQLADLVARPIGQKILNPNSQSRIYPLIESKFRTGPLGKVDGWGRKVFP
jgi:hypothetical protein